MKNYYKGLDGLRAVAVLIVMLAHAKVVYFFGGVGVDIFFVLSGYLITSIISTEVGRYGSLNFRNFYAKRFLRLTPCLVLVCIFYAAMYYAKNSVLPISTLLICLTYTANYARALFNAQLGPMGHCWSLANEEQFYLIWPLLVLMLERTVSRTRTKFFVLFGLSIALAFYRFMLVGVVSPERINFALDTHMDGLVMGAALSYLLRLGSLSQMFSRLLGYVLTPIAILGIVLIPTFYNMPDPEMGKYGFFLMAMAASVIISDIIAGRHSLIKAALSNNALVQIGKISYGLYLWHFVLFFVMDRALAQLPVLHITILKFVVSIIVATLSYYLIEIRFLKLKRHFEPSLSVEKL